MILERLSVGPLQCNCVILGDEATGRAIVIDPGDEVDRIAAALDRHGLTVGAIVATHAHIDHVGGLAELKQRTGAKALLHEADLPLYEQLAMQAQWLGTPVPPITEVDEYLSEATGIAFGKERLDVTHTPGHTPGSVSLVVPHDVPIILSGDTLFSGGIGRTDLWGGSYQEIMKSLLERLMTFPDDAFVIPGHGPPTTIGVERRTNPFLVSG